MKGIVLALDTADLTPTLAEKIHTTKEAHRFKASARARQKAS